MGREPLTTGELRGNGERSEPSIGRTDGGFWRRQTRTSEKNSERLRGGRSHQAPTDGAPTDARIGFHGAFRVAGEDAPPVVPPQ
jgi:hypothetical protein